MEKKVDIYVVGYPKSGNTWLVRMLARVLKAEVLKHPTVGKHIGRQMDINDEIEILSNYKIYKSHLSPEKLFKKGKINKESRIVYIKRNIYDVLVSSFFYFCHKGDEKYILKTPSAEIIFNPLKFYKYLKRRSLFSKYIREFCINGNKNFGKYWDHINLWSEFLSQNTNITWAMTSYENLRFDTKGEIANILKDLGLSDIDENSIQESVDEESFSKRKKEIKTTKKKLTFGRESNLKFLRKGQSGDYKRFINDKQIEYINTFIN